MGVKVSTGSAANSRSLAALTRPDAHHGFLGLDIANALVG